MMRRHFFTSVAVLTGLAMLGTALPVQAAFKIRVSENGGATYVLTVQDNMAGDLSGTTGAITALYSDATVTFSVLVGQSKPLFGNTPDTAAMDISITGTFGTGGTITVDITDTDFMPPNNPSGLGALTATIGSSAPSGSTLRGWLQGGAGGNLEFGGIDSVTGTILNTGLATAPGTLIASTVGTALAPYSLTSRTVFNGAAGSGISIDNKLVFNNPAPAGLVLALTGTPVFGLGAWLRRRRTLIAA